MRYHVPSKDGAHWCPVEPNDMQRALIAGQILGRPEAAAVYLTTTGAVFTVCAPTKDENQSRAA